MPPLTVALLSLEPWDEVWRRNQHFAVELVRAGAVSRLYFVEPPTTRSKAPFEPEHGITVVPTQRLLPKRAGGIQLLGRRLRRTLLDQVDLLWVNDPTLGAASLPARVPAIYDVTDDWRTLPEAPRAVKRIIRAEDRLARRATTVVCSVVLRDRWQERYGVTPTVVHNAVEPCGWAEAVAERLGDAGPQLGYIGSLHDERLDVPLVLSLAESLPETATLHLVGPSHLSAGSAAALTGHPKVRVHGAVPAERVPALTKGLDLLLCPHRITPFTMSLDAIKSYEYVVSGRPIVATPTSGFQDLVRPQLTVAQPAQFVESVLRALSELPAVPDTQVPSWSERAAEFRAAWPC